MSGQELYAKTRARLMSDPAGAWLWDLAEEHREEIVTLINTQRRVSVVWHRVGGPAVFAMVLENLRAGDDETLPSPPGDLPLDEALARVGRALATHGSQTLRDGLAEHSDALLTAAHGSTTLSEFLAKLRPYVISQVSSTETSIVLTTPGNGGSI